MRVVIVFDMEGASHIGHFRELFPIFPQYWDHGRRKLTIDIAAAARGLLAGGASEVLVLNHHGAGGVEWPNAVAGDLPEGARLVDGDMLRLRDDADAMFQVGAHARAGSPTFASHTILPGLRLRAGGELLSESHEWAWTGDIPLLGIVGSAGLGAGLGSLSDVPFLAVQESDDRASARPTLGSPAQTAEAIEAFATSAIRRGGRQRSRSPRAVALEASLQNADAAASAMLAAGWTRTGRTEFRIEADAWRTAGEPIDAALGAAAEAAWHPYEWSLDGMDPASRESGLEFPPARRAATEAWLTAWVNDPTVEWITPESATRWEGLDTGQAG